MRITSEWEFEGTPTKLWPYLFNAEMDVTRPFWFRMGLPKPIRCRIAQGNGEPGSTRQCITDKGYINQEILVADANRQFVYRMKDTDIYFNKLVPELKLVDTIDLTELPKGLMRVKRTTEFEAAGVFKFVKELATAFALSQAHRYASSNWKRLAAN